MTTASTIAASTVRLATLLLVTMLLGGCVGASVAVPTQFPQPLLNKIPHSVGLLLQQELTDYVHEETIPDLGDWRIELGPAQEPMFTQLLAGMFASHTPLSTLEEQDNNLKGVIQPTIKEVQISIPDQTRSDYFEVWIRYEIGVFDQGSLISVLPIAAYGKANVQNYGLTATEPALQAAAWAACRDAMAFFAVQFLRNQAIQQWLNGTLSATAAAQTSGGSR